MRRVEATLRLHVKIFVLLFNIFLSAGQKHHSWISVSEPTDLEWLAIYHTFAPIFDCRFHPSKAILSLCHRRLVYDVKKTELWFEGPKTITKFAENVFSVSSKMRFIIPSLHQSSFFPAKE